MRAGYLRQYVTIEQLTQARNAVGELTETWETFATGWADIKPTSAAEQIRGGQLGQDITHKVVMRYVEGVSADMRLVHAGRTLAIRSVINRGERGAEMQLVCVEGGTRGG